MRKLLLWIFLFSFLSSTAQDSLKTVNFSASNSGNYTINRIQTETQHQDGDAIVNYVNPVGNEFVFTINSKKPAYLTIEIFSILGQRNTIKHFSLGKGVSKFSVDVSNLPRGLYIVRFTDRNNQINLTRKLLKE